jgi:hypothetical protein
LSQSHWTSGWTATHSNSAIFLDEALIWSRWLSRTGIVEVEGIKDEEVHSRRASVNANTFRESNALKLSATKLPNARSAIHIEHQSVVMELYDRDGNLVDEDASRWSLVILRRGCETPIRLAASVHKTAASSPLVSLTKLYLLLPYYHGLSVTSIPAWRSSTVDHCRLISPLLEALTELDSGGSIAAKHAHRETQSTI